MNQIRNELETKSIPTGSIDLVAILGKRHDGITIRIKSANSLKPKFPTGSIDLVAILLEASDE
jgi:hypothetical protein